MAEDDDFAGLAPAYREALALESRGATPAEMAERLDIPVESVRSLLRLAHAKAAALDDPQPDGC